MDEGVYGTSHRHSRLGRRTTAADSADNASGIRQAVSMDSYDEDMPMDEMMDTRKTGPQLANKSFDELEPIRRGRGLSASKSFENIVAPNGRVVSSKKQLPPVVPTSAPDITDRFIGMFAMDSDGEVSSLGATYAEEKDTSTPLGRMISAIRKKSSTQPPNLSAEERLLWDCIQQSMSAMRSDHYSKRRALERQLQESSTKLAELERTSGGGGAVSDDRGSVDGSCKSVTQIEEQLKEAQRLLKERQEEHNEEIRAMQRVLADVTKGRDDDPEDLNSKIQELTAKVKALQEENKALQKPRVLNGQKRSPPLPPPPPPPPPSPGSSKSGQTNYGSSEEFKALKERAHKADIFEAELAELKKVYKDAEADKIVAKKELDKKSRRLIVLERDYKAAKIQNTKNDEAMSNLTKKHDGLRAQLDELQRNSGKGASISNRGVTSPPRPEHAAVPQSPTSLPSDVETLQRNLVETTASLENAKKIIASLESANGSLALDLRGKLKVKEEELAAIQTESNDRKRHLDSLATELRDLQRKHGDVQRSEEQGKSQILRLKVLSSQLAQSVSGLQSASVVHEVSTATGMPDSTNVDHVAEILGDTLIAIKTTLESTDEYIDTFDDKSVIDTDSVVNSEVGRQVDALIQKDREAAAKDLRQELEAKNSTVRRLEEAMKKQNEELKRLRALADNKDRGNEMSNQMLRAEIQSLREQCATNMEVLAKKERELSVLRSSLKVDDDDGGYISDDASETEYEDQDGGPPVASPTRLNGYDPSQTEALATLMSHTGTGIDVPGRAQELEQLKGRLSALQAERERSARELQEERESLANAKMIISSLEKANKSMMEDLRSRLQDSNTAIASLLEKSVDNEKTTATLKEELEKMKKERDDLEKLLSDDSKKGSGDSKKLKDQNTVLNLRIAAKDRELEALKGGQVMAVEEKKEEISERL